MFVVVVVVVVVFKAKSEGMHFAKIFSLMCSLSHDPIYLTVPFIILRHSCNTGPMLEVPKNYEIMNNFHSSGFLITVPE